MDDIELRLQCFTQALQARDIGDGTGMMNVLADAVTLYNWVKGRVEPFDVKAKEAA